jgi:Putative quorum-sensing-regulated virulence factor
MTKMSIQTGRAPLEDKTAKLILLALDPHAAPGEVDNAAVALVHSLRRQYSDGFSFLAELTDKRPPEPDNRYGETQMPFGKHKGRQLRDIDPTYLLWVLANCTNADAYLKIAIRRFLG